MWHFASRFWTFNIDKRYGDVEWIVIRNRLDLEFRMKTLHRASTSFALTDGFESGRPPWKYHGTPPKMPCKNNRCGGQIN